MQRTAPDIEAPRLAVVLHTRRAHFQRRREHVRRRERVRQRQRRRHALEATRHGLRGELAPQLEGPRDLTELALADVAVAVLVHRGEERRGVVLGERVAELWESGFKKKGARRARARARARASGEEGVSV